MYNLAIRKSTSPPLLAPRLKIFKLKFTTPPRIKPRTCWTIGSHAIIWASAASWMLRKYRFNIEKFWLPKHNNSINISHFKIASFYFFFYISEGARRVIGISGSLIWSKILMELTFNPCGEFRRRPEGPISQILSPQLHVGAPGIFQIF